MKISFKWDDRLKIKLIYTVCWCQFIASKTLLTCTSKILSSRIWFFIFFVTDVGHSWALVDSKCISEVISITYFFAIFVELKSSFVQRACIFYTSRDKESNLDELGCTTALVYVDYYAWLPITAIDTKLYLILISTLYV